MEEEKESAVPIEGQDEENSAQKPKQPRWKDSEWQILQRIVQQEIEANTSLVWTHIAQQYNQQKDVLFPERSGASCRALYRRMNPEQDAEKAKWSLRETCLLYALRSIWQPPLKWGDIALRMKLLLGVDRSATACRLRFSVLQTDPSILNPRLAYKRWSKEEDEAIMEAKDKAATILEQFVIFGTIMQEKTGSCSRSYESFCCRRKRLLGKRSTSGSEVTTEAKDAEQEEFRGSAPEDDTDEETRMQVTDTQQKSIRVRRTSGIPPTCSRKNAAR